MFFFLQIAALSFRLDEEEEDEEDEKEDEKKVAVSVPAPVVDDHDDKEFSVCEEESLDAGDEPLLKKKKISKNPDVDTSFLPDRDREEEERKLREELRQVCILKNIPVYHLFCFSSYVPGWFKELF